ncbi:MAG: hypothetical protein HXY29_14940, partial [Rhodocyclaceae bacterium]|nr:hypothetical protein [Rhodocyclaceae bacterium]
MRLEVPSPGIAVTVRATITPHQTTARTWSVAGLMVYFDDGDYWRLALVQAPDDPDRRYAELVEMLGSVWQAQNEPTTRLEGATEGELQWAYDRPYQLELRLSADRVEGTIAEGGAVRYRRSYELAEGVQAVRKGWPGVETIEMRAEVSDLEGEVLRFAGSRPPLPPGREPIAIVLADSLPGTYPRVADVIARGIRRAGLEGRALSAAELCNPGDVPWDAVDLLAIPECQTVPLEARRPVLDYVARGGHLLLTGGPGKPTFDQIIGVSLWALALLVAVVLIAILAALEQFQPWRDEVGTDWDGLQPDTAHAAAGS